MNDQELQVTAIERAPSAGIEVAHGGGPNGTSPLRMIHRRLRGRYLWAILLGLLGAAGGGYLGWGVKVPEYTAQGLIYIRPTMLSPKDPTGTSVLPMFQSFVAYQVELLGSPRTSVMAMETDTWSKTGQDVGLAVLSDFQKRRRILHAHGTSHVVLQFTDPDADVALAGVRALIEAYTKLSEDLNDANSSLEYARAQTDRINSKLKASTDQILTMTAEFGGIEGVEIRHRAAVKNVLEAETLLGEVRQLLRDYKDGEGAAASATAIPPEEIAVESAPMATALQELDLLEAEFEYQAEKLGDKNEGLVRLRRRIEARKKRIGQLAKAWNRVRATKQAGGATKEELQAREERLAKHLESLGSTSLKIGRTRADVERLQANNEDLQRELAEMVALKSELTAKLMGKGRIEVSDLGARPGDYSRDKRPSYAAAGGLLGAALGVLIVLLIGLRDRRLKDSGDIDTSLSRVRLLGLLPWIDAAEDDAEDQQVAAQCVHQIRTFLQIGHARQEGACICISGPGVASGKTTLTTALGLSFGSSGTRTLLVDADLTGRGLTWRVSQMLIHRAREVAGGSASTHVGNGDTERRSASHSVLGPLLYQTDGVDWPEAAELGVLLSQSLDRLGLRDAKASGVIDDLFALADLLYSGEVRDALASKLMTALASEGVLTFGSPAQWIPPRVMELEARKSEFNGSPLERYLYRTGVDSLRFLPLRGLGRGGEVSVATITKIVARIKNEFDVALFDTGPVPGSVETSMVAANADSVVLVMSPGDQRPDAQRAVAHMEDVGARLAGIVFNRADHKEVLRASMSRSYPSNGIPRA